MLAIIIPYFKLTFFEAALSSLANQTDKRFKVYIGDDASPENPEELLKKYQGSFDFVYKKFEKNLGSISLTQQWERCIELTDDEEWLMILGDDDVLSKNVVESFYEKLNEIDNENINVIRFATQKINKEGGAISKVYEHSKIEKSTNFLFNKTRSSLSEHIFRKKQVEEIKFKNFPLAWYSDTLAIFEFSNFGNIYTINNSRVYIRVSELSISGNSSYDKQKELAKFEFYYYLLKRRFNCFTKDELNELYHRINKCYVNNKKQFGFFLKISKLYIQKKLFKEYFRFIKLILFFTKKRINS